MTTKKSAQNWGKNRRSRSKQGELPNILKSKNGTAYMNFRGRRYFLGPFGSEESERKRRSIVAEVETGNHHQSRRVTVTVLMLVGKFLDYAKCRYQKHGRSTGSYERFRITVKPLLQLYADVSVNEFRPSSLKVIRQKMIDSGLCRRIVNQRVGFLKQIFAWGVGEELVDETVAARLKYVENLQEGMTTAPDYDPISAVPMEVVEKTLPFCHPVLADMIRVQMLAGMRPQDVCNMRLCDIDMSHDVWEYTPWEHKTEHKMKTQHSMGMSKKPQLIRWLGPKAQEVLSPYILAKSTTPEAFFFSPADAVKYLEMEKLLPIVKKLMKLP
jgi:hypothetical protein